MPTPLDLAYPLSLPGPCEASVDPAERRLLSGPPGALDVRDIQRDYLAKESLRFIYSFAQAEIFEEWWGTTLHNGGASFSANWPHPLGAAAIRRYLGTPVWSRLIPGYGWEITADFEVQGRTTLNVPTTVEAVSFYFVRAVALGAISSAQMHIIDDYVDFLQVNLRGSLAGSGLVYLETPDVIGGTFNFSAGSIYVSGGVPAGTRRTFAVQDPPSPAADIAYLRNRIINGGPVRLDLLDAGFELLASFTLVGSSAEAFPMRLA